MTPRDPWAHVSATGYPPSELSAPRSFFPPPSHCTATASDGGSSITACADAAARKACRTLAKLQGISQEHCFMIVDAAALEQDEEQEKEEEEENWEGDAEAASEAEQERRAGVGAAFAGKWCTRLPPPLTHTHG